MRVYRVKNSSAFEEVPEVAMDVHYGVPTKSSGDDYFVIVGGRLAISMYGEQRATLDDIPEQPWLRPGTSAAQRVEAFNTWLGKFDDLDFRPADPRETLIPVSIRRQDAPNQPPIVGLIVTPLGPLPPTPIRPASIYGHLPFGTKTASDTLIYRWEAFPTSLRIKRTPHGGDIAKDTYAAPASEVPFAPTGFSAVGRFALPNLMPACFRWELQPQPGTPIECGASVPLYGQAGGGVEVRFPNLSHNRCPIADPVVLPAL